MADYSPLISRAVAALKENTGEARRAVYDRARTALLAQLRGMNPPLPEETITRERVALEDAIRRVDAEYSAPPVQPEAAASVEAAPVAAEPVSIGGAKAVHEAAEAAEALGSAAPEVTRAAREVLADPSPATAPRIEPVIAAPAPDVAPVRDEGAPQPIRPRIPVLPPHDELEEPVRKGRGGLVAVAVAVGVLALGGGAGWYFANQPPASPAAITPPPASPRPATAPDLGDRPKIADRVGDPAPPAAPAPAAPATPAPSLSQPAPAAPASPQPAPAPVGVAQRAALFEETPGAQQGALMPGTVVWRTQSIAVGQGQPPDLAIVGEIQIPERRMTVTLTIRRNLDQTLPASHTIEVFFTLPRDFQFGGVTEVPGVLMKGSEQARGIPLVGQAVRISPGFFLIGLSAFDADRQSNTQSLRTRGFFDIPLRYDNGRRAILTVEKGSTGERTFDEALTAWGQ